MTFIRTKGIALLALLLVLPLAACESGTDAQFGTVSLKLTDAMSEEVTEAWVTITDVYLQEESGEEDPLNSRVYLMEDGEETYELLSLAEDVADLVVGAEVSTGVYDQLRLVITGGCIVVGDGEAATVYGSSDSYDLCGPVDQRLHMPSYAQSGAKILLYNYEVVGGQQILLLDFDVSQSFGHEAGNSGMWVMHPVIHWSELGLTVGADVTLSPGEVTLPEGFDLGQFSATLLPTTGDSSRVDFTDVDENGIYELAFQYKDPDNGPFDIRLNAPEGLTVETDPASPVTVSPASGETAYVDWVLQSATEESSGS